MPATSPWLDTWAPPQWFYHESTNTPPEPATSGQDSGVFQNLMSAASNSTGFDTTVHWKVGGTIILALVIIFGLQAMGFRFVTSANVALGR